jgi:acid stress chaperone HdeB
MLRWIATIAIALLHTGILATTASAEKIDIATVSCKQFIDSVERGSASDKSGMGNILYWISGYSVTEEQDSVVDFSALAKDFDKILAGCKAQPMLGVLTVASKHLGENATAHGAEAIDLKTMTCSAAVNTSDDDTEGLGFILMWIAGYQASDSENTIFDTASFEADMNQIGEYCASHPAVGLLTASNEIMGDDEEEGSAE